MKKTLLTLIAGICIGTGLLAQTISLPWNQYGGAPKIGYQGKDASKTTAYTPAIGDVITVHIAGTASHDITELQVALIDDAAAVGYWGEFLGFKTLGSPTAGVAFDYEVDITVTAIDKAGTALSNPKLVFDGKNATLAGADGTGTAITLDLTTYTVSVFKPIPGATILTGNTDTKQITQTLLAASPTIKAGDVVRVTMKGQSDVAISDVKAFLIDESSDATTPYWTVLSDYINFDPKEATAGQQFTMVVDIPVVTTPAGTSAKLQNIGLLATTTSKLVQLSLTEFTAVILPKAVTGVTLLPATGSITTNAGTVQLTATVAPADAANKGVTYSISDGAIASVSTNGLVTAKANGTVTVTVTTDDGAKTASSVITITGQTIPAVDVIGVSLNQNVGTITTNGGTLQLTATVAPANATIQTYTYTISDQTIASVSTTGLVTAIKNGQATVTVTTTDGAKTATCVVTITGQIVPVTGVSLDKTTAAITTNAGTVQLTANVAPADAPVSTYTFSSSDANIATVSSTGLVTAVKNGNATITVSTTDGAKVATCVVTVTGQIVTVTGVSVSAASGATGISTKGGKLQLTATIAPVDATTKTVTWSTSDASIATISATGLVTAVADGAVTFTATSTDVTTISGTITLAISNQTTSSDIEKAEFAQKGNEFTFNGSAVLLNVLGKVVASGVNGINASAVPAVSILLLLMANLNKL